jgi:hypothetical protein
MSSEAVAELGTRPDSTGSVVDALGKDHQPRKLGRRQAQRGQGGGRCTSIIAYINDYHIKCSARTRASSPDTCFAASVLVLSRELMSRTANTAFISYSHSEWENFAHMELTRVAEGLSLHVMCMPILSIPAELCHDWHACSFTDSVVIPLDYTFRVPIAAKGLPTQS